jgi:hypothetical protein
VRIFNALVGQPYKLSIVIRMFIGAGVAQSV